MNKRILILHGSSDLYGASKILLNTIKALLQDGYIVKVVLTEEGPLVAEILKLGVEVIFIRLGILRRKYFNIKGLANRLKVIYKARKQLLKITHDDSIDIIYSNTSAVLVGFIVAYKARLKHIWHIHEIIQKPPFFSKFISRLLKKSDLVILVSNEVKQHWEKILGTQQSNFKVIYNGIDYSPYLNTIGSHLHNEPQNHNKKFIIGMIARINTWKGQKYFLEIASLIIIKKPNVHFIMVGDVVAGNEYMYGELKEKIVQLNLEEHITDLGFRADVPNILAGLDLFILPSILPDPLPTIILEAMGSGKPVVATAHGGALEMVLEGETGITIPWDNAAKAAEQILKLIEQEDIQKMGLNGRDRALSSFSLNSFNQNIQNEIKQISEGSPV